MRSVGVIDEFDLLLFFFSYLYLTSSLLLISCLRGSCSVELVNSLVRVVARFVFLSCVSRAVVLSIELMNE